MTSDTSPSPRPETASEGEADEPGEQPGSGRTETPSLLGRFLGWSSNGAVEADAAPDDATALGPAFHDSSPAELTMVANILRLRDLRVEDVMTPRADIIAVEEEAGLGEVLQAVDMGSFSRLPVYRETLDDPRGFVHLKDLALAHGFDRAPDGTEFKLSNHVRPALFVPPSMRIAALLQKMQGERVHMALVIDEFGGVDGLVTIEDLVEQVVGDIEDEHDAEDAAEWLQDSDGSWLIQARADIEEFQAASGLAMLPEGWEEDADTLGGLVFTLANRVPTRGEVIPHPNGHELEIVDADPRRIKRVRLRAANGNAVVRQAAE